MSEKLHHERGLIKQIIRVLKLPRHQYFVNGSGSLAMHGVPRERPMGDLDIFLTTDLWFSVYNRSQLAKSFEQYWSPDIWTLIVPGEFPMGEDQPFDPPILRSRMFDLPVDLFLNWRRRNDHSDFDCSLYLKNAVNIEGVQCVPIEMIAEWKLAYGRDKDLLDVIEIRRFLRGDYDISR